MATRSRGSRAGAAPGSATRRRALRACRFSARSSGARVGPAFVGGTHPLARVAGVTNGVVIDAPRGAQCYIGPGAGPDVTAETLLDDVAEIVRERRVLAPPPEPVHTAASVSHPDSA